jgi:hypothetical protein
MVVRGGEGSWVLVVWLFRVDREACAGLLVERYGSGLLGMVVLAQWLDGFELGWDAT